MMNFRSLSIAKIQKYFHSYHIPYVFFQLFKNHGALRVFSQALGYLSQALGYLSQALGIFRGASAELHPKSHRHAVVLIVKNGHRWQSVKKWQVERDVNLTE